MKDAEILWLKVQSISDWGGDLILDKQALAQTGMEPVCP
jgi:hypothetical protein